MVSPDGGDVFDFENMTDDEVRQVVLEHLRDAPNLDADDIDVHVLDGLVTLSGRVGTDAEVRVAEALLDDVLDLDDFANDLVVDELRRGDLPEAPDDAAAELAERGDLGGDDRSQQTDTADHLVEDLDSDMLGTRDMGRAIRDGTAYNPPDQPVSDGYGSREDH